MESDLGEEEKSENTEEKLMILTEKTLSHLQEDEKFEIQESLMGSNTISRSIDDLRPANIPVKHSLILKDSPPIYARGRSLPPKHNKIFHQEMGRCWMLGL